MAVLLASFYFFYFAIVAVHIIFLPKVLSEIGYLPSEIGIIFASAPLVRFLVPFLFLKGLKLNHDIFVKALIILALSALAFYPSLEYFYPLLISNILLGIGMSLILPYIEVIALKNIGKEGYGKIRLYGSLGFILVALVLVKFLSSPYVAINYLIVMVFFTTLFAYIIAQNEQKTSTEPIITQSTFSLSTHWSLWLALLLMQMSFGPFYNFFTIYETAHGISLDMTIYLWSFGVVVEIVMLYFQGPLLKKNLLLVMQIVTLITVARWLLLYLYPEHLMLLFFSQSLHAFSFALFHSASIAYLFSLYSEQKLAQQFYFGITYGLGGFLGAITSGYIYQYLPNYLFLSAAFTAFMAFIFFSVDKKRVSLKN